MKFFNFHLMPYADMDVSLIREHGSAWVTFPNRHYDPKVGAALYNRYLDELEYADRLGFDGVCVNEHHQTAYGLMPVPGVMAGALARSVKRARIAVLGRALPLVSNPLSIAEEFAMLDNLCHGRFIAGFVRGIGAEYHSTGVNPAESLARFQEAHDLIIRAWSEPGPFEFDGEYYHYRYVNLWPRPYQAPHPPVWVPSQGSAETIAWAARHRYTYCQTLGAIKTVAGFFNKYREEADKAGYAASWDQCAWSTTIYVAETDEQALREAGPHAEAIQNEFLRMPLEMLLPPGYTSLDSYRHIQPDMIGKPQTVRSLNDAGVIIIGSPSTVRERLAEYQQLAGFNTVLVKTQFGTLPADMTRANMEALAREVLPYFQEAAA